MTEHTLDLKRSFRILWRHRIIVGIFAALGFIAGAVYTVYDPPMLTSQAVVVLPPSVHDTRTQVVIASSDPVLAGALRIDSSQGSLTTLRTRVRVNSMAYNVISISVQGKTAAEAEGTANAVARSYVDYVGSGRMPAGAVRAQVLEPASDAKGMSLPISMLLTAVIGALCGLLVGAIAVLAIRRSDRRLRTRDEIAESIGVPVLASIPVSHPSDTAGWKKLLEEYEPGPVDAWRLRKVLQHLNLVDGDGRALSLTMLSLSADRKALALGPQLAVFAASIGVPTALIISPPNDMNATATLRAASTVPLVSLRGSRNLRVVVSGDGINPLPGVLLTIAVAVVDAMIPKVAGMMRTSATVLGISAGSVTADQLASVAVSAADDGRHIDGILVADPDPGDQSTGRLPQLMRPAQPNTKLMTGTAVEFEK